MQLSDITATFSVAAGRFLRRLGIGTALVLFALIALAIFTAAGIVALQINFGLLLALLIAGGAYACVAVVLLVGLLATRRKSLLAASAPGAPLSPRNMQITMLLEAVMLGYMLANKTSRSHHNR